MGYYGPSSTWKIVYIPKEMNNGMRGVALVEAETRSEAFGIFQREYAGQFLTTERIEKL